MFKCVVSYVLMFVYIDDIESSQTYNIRLRIHKIHNNAKAHIRPIRPKTYKIHKT